MADISRITTRLWCGAALTTAQDVEDVCAAGVTHIIDCRLEFDDQSLVDGYNQADLGPTASALKHRPELHYLYNGVADDGQPKPVEWFAKSIGFALSALGTPYAVVLTHCAAGVNRGPSAAFAVLLAQGWTSDVALQLLRQHRPVAQVAYAGDAMTAVRMLGYVPA